jgi:uncharacterized protein YgiB involved in biofilm formation
MKRSKTIGLVMMSASVFALTACDEPAVDAAVFENLSQCLANGDVEREQCETDYQAAKSQHAQVAPKYTSQQDCEADFGAEQCQTSSQHRTESGGSIFMPLMMGYMMGSMIGGRSGVASQPLYRSKDDAKSYRTADNKKVGNQIGRTQVAKSTGARPSAKSSTLSRGGFGARARSFGSVAG